MLRMSLDIEMETNRAVTKLQGCGVEHGDVRPPNVLWNEEISNVVLVNFERSEILTEDAKSSRRYCSTKSESIFTDIESCQVVGLLTNVSLVPLAAPQVRDSVDLALRSVGNVPFNFINICSQPFFCNQSLPRSKFGFKLSLGLAAILESCFLLEGHIPTSVGSGRQTKDLLEIDVIRELPGLSISYDLLTMEY
jgi:hypothetical protein